MAEAAQVQSSIDWSKYGSLWTFQAGEYVFHEDDPGDSMYVIKSGRVAIVKLEMEDQETLVLGYSDVGRLLGEVSLIQGTPRTAAVQAVQTTELFVIPRGVFWLKFDEEPEFCRLILTMLIGHLLAADQGRIDAAAAQRALAEVIKLRQEMSNFTFHDLQNPLATIMAAVSEIRQTPGYVAATEVGEMVEHANNAVERMLNLVSSLLDTERLKNADAQLNKSPFRATDLIREIVERSQPLASHKGVQLRADTASPGLEPINADRQRIDRVLTNLIDNALKFTPNNGCITVSVKPATVSSVWSVKDTGPGIPLESRERVFQKFVQTDSGSTSQRGFGLGLAFCYAAVLAHNGTIWVEDGDGGIGKRKFYLRCLLAHRTAASYN